MNESADALNEFRPLGLDDSRSGAERFEHRDLQRPQTKCATVILARDESNATNRARWPAWHCDVLHRG